MQGALLTLAYNANVPNQLRVDVIIPLFPKGIKNLFVVVQLAGGMKVFTLEQNLVLQEAWGRDS